MPESDSPLPEKVTPTLAELTLLLPARERLLASGSSDILSLWLARGDKLADIAAGREAALRVCFEFTGTSIPYAALTRSLDASDAAGALWLRADPAFVMADAVTLRLLACGELRLSTEECGQLARALKPLFGDAGFPLESTTASHWYLRCPPGAQLPAFSNPAVALGDDLGRHLPQGGDARRWQHLLNEAQVMLHNHPVNAERSKRGLMPVNSLWIWGGGALPDFVRSTFTHVRSPDQIVHALARQAKVPVIDDDASLDVAVDASRVLLDLSDMREEGALERDWLAPIHEAVLQRRVASVEVRFEDGLRHLWRRAHRWRFWRRVKRAKSA